MSVLKSNNSHQKSFFYFHFVTVQCIGSAALIRTRRGKLCNNTVKLVVTFGICANQDKLFLAVVVEGVKYADAHAVFLVEDFLHDVTAEEMGLGFSGVLFAVGAGPAGGQVQGNVFGFVTSELHGRKGYIGESVQPAK